VQPRDRVSSDARPVPAANRAKRAPGVRPGTLNTRESKSPPDMPDMPTDGHRARGRGRRRENPRNRYKAINRINLAEAYNGGVSSTASHHGGPAPAGDGHVDAAERLLHRRRGWVWIAVLSLIGFLGYAVIGAHFFPHATGAVADISAAIVLVLLGLVAAGLIVAIVDTVRLHRLDGPVRARARGQTVHHRVVAHAYRYPPKHRVTGVFGKLLLVFWIVLTISVLPDQVNAVAFLAGAGSNTTFFPSSYVQNCGRGGCTTVTDGTMASGARTVDATFPYQIPLDQPVTVRAPVWPGWGSITLVGDTAHAVVSIVVGLLFDLIAAVGVYSFVVMIRHWMARRRGTAASVPA